jgi:hypothetical protein
MVSEVSRRNSERKLQDGADPTSELYTKHTNVHVRRLAFLKMVAANKGVVDINDVKLGELKINEDWFNNVFLKQFSLPMDEEDVALAHAD